MYDFLFVGVSLSLTLMLRGFRLLGYTRNCVIEDGNRIELEPGFLQENRNALEVSTAGKNSRI